MHPLLCVECTRYHAGLFAGLSNIIDSVDNLNKNYFLIIIRELNVDHFHRTPAIAVVTSNPIWTKKI